MTIKQELKFIKKYLEHIKFDITDKIECKTIVCDTLDTLCQNNDISEKVYNNTYLTFNKSNKMYLVCGSYKELLRPTIYITFDNYKEVNKHLKSNHIEVNSDGEMILVNNRTNAVFSIIPFEEYYSIHELDLQ